MAFASWWQAVGEQGWLLGLSLLCLSLGLASCRSIKANLAGLLSLSLAACVTLFWACGLVWLAALGGAAVFLFPVFLLMWGLRSTQLSLRRFILPVQLKQADGEDLAVCSVQWEGLGFEELGDASLRPAPPSQVFRFLVSQDKKSLVTITRVEDEGSEVVFSCISSWDGQGSHWMTWNFVLPHCLKQTPDMRMYRIGDAETATELMEAHAAFLQLNEVAPVVREGIGSLKVCCRLWGKYLRRQIEFNLQIGWLCGSHEKLRFSVRGTAGAIRQIFTEIIRPAL